MKYIIRLIDGQISCEETSPNKEIRYIQKEFEFFQIINKIIRDGFKVKRANNNMFLCSDSYMIRLTDYQDILKMREFERLKLYIQRTIEKEGYIDLTNEQNINKKSNRNNKYAKEAIVKVSALILAAGATTIVFTSISQSKKQQNTNTTKEEIRIEETQQVQRVTEFEEIITEEKKENDGLKIPEVKLDFEELFDTEKAETAKEKYYEIIEKQARAYGIDPNLMLGICTQERGVHSTKIDKGGGIGLAQIQYNIWNDEDITANKYNEQTGKFEPHTIHVTKSVMQNLETNIELGCMILQNYLINSNYNIPVAIQMYNMGPSSIYKILNRYAKDNNLTVDEVLSNPEDLGWLDYRQNTPGDPEYLENVNQWIYDNTFKVINIKTGEDVQISFDNSQKTK